MFPDAIIKKIISKSIDSTIDGIVAMVKGEEENIEKHHDMTDPYFIGYTDALGIMASAINCVKSKEK